MSRRSLAVALVITFALAGVPDARADRPMGHVFDWSHELSQRRLPQWHEPTAPPVPAATWYRTIDGMLERAGRNGLWFSGYNALPFDIPTHPRDPSGWRNPRVLGQAFSDTGLTWDVNLEARAATRALGRGGAVVSDPRVLAPTRRLSLIDPAYERAALSEIRRIVPRHAGLPYVFAYTGSDEPVAVLPHAVAARSALWRRIAREAVSRYGHPLPSADAPPSRSPAIGLRWLAYSRLANDRFVAMKARQATLIRQLDSDALVIPNNFFFIDGFVPWDYSRFGFADVVEGDPYVSLAERRAPGRGRYNHGFGAKLLADLSGKPVRIIVQAFRYAGYTPTPNDIETWSAQALRAGATHISFYALGNPRFTNRPLYGRMLGLARRLRDSRLPDAPIDPGSLVLYATASEGQARPYLTGEERYRTNGDALYTTYSLLGELAHGAFTFTSDTTLATDPRRLDAARVIWMPRGDTLDRPVAERLAAWVEAGGTLIVSDPSAFTRDPDGTSLRSIRTRIIGSGLTEPRRGGTMRVDGAGVGEPDGTLSIPIASSTRAFAAVPAGATVAGTLPDGAPALILRTVGAGKVIAFATNPMRPAALDTPRDLVALIAALHRLGGGTLDHPAWRYRIPGATGPESLPWPGSYVP